MEIPVINVNQIRQPYIHPVYVPRWMIQQPNVDYLLPPVVVNVGTPIVDMPGCVKMHKDNKRHKNGVPIDKSLIENDSGEAMTICPDGSYPSYDAMNYEPEQLTIVREVPPPAVSPPPDPPDSPETPTDTKVPEKEVECPGPMQPRVGDLTQSGDEKVIGHEIQEINPGQKVCVVLYEPTNIADKYLPAPQLVTTTAVIATVATGSALLAKPLADLLMKVMKPAIKKVVGTIQKILGKEQKVQLSLRERMEQQRERTQAIRELKRMRKLN